MPRMKNARADAKEMAARRRQRGDALIEWPGDLIAETSSRLGPLFPGKKAVYAFTAKILQ